MWCLTDGDDAVVSTVQQALAQIVAGLSVLDVTTAGANDPLQGGSN
jgi:hypothetical protein